ncbi:anhydro-N-acetylmuramic acid kinase [Flagellimonas sp.]|uniref:anhydro-N-acetylmuramic acid kinase n=1 Tax=Flagellimonas sp. TaxID=2058762 RepID=UPI003F49EC40
MKEYKVLGMMSGTSLDGLDLAFCRFSKSDQKWNFSIEKTTAISYDTTWKNRLKHAIHLSDKEHDTLDHEYGVWLGKQAKQFLEDAQEEVDFIASHGHTSHHRPEEGFTFQLGNGQELANASGQKVICDFRTKDVKLGGQGAPLVPIGDHLLFGKYDFCLNLGGISNVSFVKEGKRKALDIGMANMPLNHITQKINLEYDENGQLAQSGKLLPELKTALDNLEYYTLPHPKSTGYEWFLADVVPLIENSEGSVPDLLHTLIHHNCEQIASEIAKFRTKSNNTMFVTGGGAFNSFFMETLQQKLGNSFTLKIPNKTLIAFKEALVFALMGVLREENQTNIFASVTGARENSCSGEVFFPNV